MAPPSCRVFPRPQFSGRGRIENRFDPPPQPTGCLRLRFPDWLKDLEEMCLANLADRKVAHDRMDIGGEGVLPLLAVLGVPTTVIVVGDVALRHGPEGCGSDFPAA